MVVKSNTSLNSQIKHLQEELRSKDEIINQTLALLSNITNNELQSKNDTVNKLTDALIASNQHCGKEDINILEHEKNNNNKNKITMRKMILNDQIMQLKFILRMRKSVIHQKRPSQMTKTFIKYTRRKPE